MYRKSFWHFLNLLQNKAQIKCSETKKLNLFSSILNYSLFISINIIYMNLDFSPPHIILFFFLTLLCFLLFFLQAPPTNLVFLSPSSHYVLYPTSALFSNSPHPNWFSTPSPSPIFFFTQVHILSTHPLSYFYTFWLHIDFPHILPTYWFPTPFDPIFPTPFDPISPQLLTLYWFPTTFDPILIPHNFWPHIDSLHLLIHIELSCILNWYMFSHAFWTDT